MKSFSTNFAATKEQLQLTYKLVLNWGDGSTTSYYSHGRTYVSKINSIGTIDCASRNDNIEAVSTVDIELFDYDNVFNTKFNTQVLTKKVATLYVETMTPDTAQSDGGASKGAGSIMIKNAPYVFPVGISFTFASHATVYTVLNSSLTSLWISPSLSQAVVNNDTLIINWKTKLDYQHNVLFSGFVQAPVKYDVEGKKITLTIDSVASGNLKKKIDTSVIDSNYTTSTLAVNGPYPFSLYSRWNKKAVLIVDNPSNLSAVVQDNLLTKDFIAIHVDAGHWADTDTGQHFQVGSNTQSFPSWELWAYNYSINPPALQTWCQIPYEDGSTGKIFFAAVIDGYSGNNVEWRLSVPLQRAPYGGKVVAIMAQTWEPNVQQTNVSKQYVTLDNGVGITGAGISVLVINLNTGQTWFTSATNFTSWTTLFFTTQPPFDITSGSLILRYWSTFGLYATGYKAYVTNWVNYAALQPWPIIEATRKLGNYPTAIYAWNSQYYGQSTNPVFPVSCNFLFSPYSTSDGMYNLGGIYSQVLSSLTAGIDNTGSVLDSLVIDWLGGDGVTYSVKSGRAAPYKGYLCTDTSMDLWEALRLVAWEHCCAIQITQDNKINTVLLKGTPTSKLTITASDIDMGSIEIGSTSSDDLYTTFKAQSYDWMPDGIANGAANGDKWLKRQVAYSNNVSKYGNIAYNDINTISIRDWAGGSEYMTMMLKFWGYRKSNIWKHLKFKTYLNAFAIEPFDVITLNLDSSILGVASTMVLVLSTKFDPTDNTIEIEVECPIQVGTSVVDNVYWNGPA